MFTEPTGIVASDGYPKPFAPLQACIWRITAPAPAADGDKATGIKLKFDALDVSSFETMSTYTRYVAVSYNAN